METKSKESIGLVFSGGGIRGIAHIGVIKALEELGIEAEYVAGTSAGSLVGAFYAAGYSADEMLHFFNSTSVFRWQHMTYRKPGMIDIEKLTPLFLKYFPGNSFESLSKKLFVVATDILAPKEVVFQDGPLIPRILASSAIPVVFSPIEMDGSLFADGGITNNFPIQPLQPYCQKIIGVNVSPLKGVDKEEISSSFSIMERVYHIGTTIHYNNKFKDCDVLIAPEELNKFWALDLKQIQETFNIGYQAAMAQKSQLLQLVGSKSVKKS